MEKHNSGKNNSNAYGHGTELSQYTLNWAFS